MVRPCHVSNCFELLKSVAEVGRTFLTNSKEETTYNHDLTIVNIYLQGHM